MSRTVATYDVRRVRAEDGPSLRTMRLEALQDPAAPIAFLETYAVAEARPAAFWAERAAGAADGSRTAQYVAITRAPDGSEHWVAAVTGLREDPDSADWAGHPVRHLQAHVVGVWVHHDHRGAGLLGRLVGEVEAWAATYDAERLRLLVHEDNARAQAAYRKIGFTPTGVKVTLGAAHELEMARPLA